MSEQANEVAVRTAEEARLLPRAAELIQRLEKWTLKTSTCWLWQGALHRSGYARVKVGGRAGRVEFVHRVSWIISGGRIPEGYHLDHLCRVRACINPEHLEAVPAKVNILRGIGPTAINKRKTHCPQGHGYDAENTYVNPYNGQRSCRACHREREGRRRRDAHIRSQTSGGRS